MWEEMGSREKRPLSGYGEGIERERGLQTQFQKLVSNASLCNWLSSREPSVSALLDQCAILWGCQLGPASAAKSHQLCLILCDPIDSLLPGSPVPGILQARTLEWVAISFSNALKWKAKVKSLSHVWLLATSWTAAYQGPPSMGFSRQEYWNGVPLPSPWSLLIVYK